MAARRLNLAAIEASLRAVQRDFPRLNASLQTSRVLLSDEIIANLMTAYALVDALIAAGLDLFAMGNLRYLLELNRRVLWGSDPNHTAQRDTQFALTERHFYEHTEGNIGRIVEWYAGHRHQSVWKRAAGVYVRVLSEPQLFLEGNHRSGALLISYLLAREGRPPLVLTPDNAKAYFDPSSLIKDTRRTPVSLLFKLPGLKKRFARFLQAQADDRYLDHAGSLPSPAASQCSSGSAVRSAASVSSSRQACRK
jgi:hypothetical protein